MPSTISTAGMAQLSTNEKLFKTAIETAIDTAGLVTMSAATASNDGFMTKEFAGLMADATAIADGILTKEDFATFSAKQTATLADGKILVGNVSNVATAVTPSGIVTLSNAGATAIACADGKILAGNASNVAAAVTPSGVVAMANTGVFTFSTNFDNVATTDSNGQLTIANMTSSGGAVVMALAATGTNVVTHCTPATGTLTVNVNGTTNVLASTSVAYHVCKL
jgi:hypothetical protein